MSITIEIECTETGPLTEEVKVTMRDEGGLTIGRGSGLAGDATALALLDLVQNYSTKPSVPRYAPLIAAFAKIKALVKRY